MTIEGMLFDVTGNELQKHFREKASYHSKRIEVLTAVKAKVGDAVDKVAIDLDLDGDEIDVSYATNSNAGGHVSVKDRIEAALNQHKTAVIRFNWLAAHVDNSATFRLGEGEIQRIGLVKLNP